MWLKRIQRQVAVTQRDRGRDETGDMVDEGGTSTDITDCKWMDQDFRIPDVADGWNEFVQKNISLQKLFFNL